MDTAFIGAGLALGLALLVGIHRKLHRPRPRVAVLVLFLLTCVVGSNAPPKPGPSPVESAPVSSQAPATLLCPSYNAATSPLPTDLTPSETAAAGSIPGSFGVSRVGEATYSIPLVVPPGRGLEPSLAITYGSSGGEGFLGVGFGLAGFSAIARCPANLAQDGMIRPVRYDDVDALCLDGARLVQVAAAFDFDGSGTREYRTMPDTFVKVVAHFGPGQHLERGADWFEVFTKSGRIVEYGSTDTARAMAKNQVIAAWWMSRERDRRENAIEYTYDNERDNGDGHTIEIVPSRILYAHRTPNLPLRIVRLMAADAPTPVTYFSGGMKLRRTKLLSRVEMVIEPGEKVVRSYHLDYQPGEGTGRPLLRSVRECAGASGPCKPETRFGWNSDAGGGLQKGVTPKMIPDDGFSHWERMTWLLADVNGDGLDDLVVTHPSPEDSDTAEWWVGLNTGGAFAAPKLWASFPYPSGNTGPWSATPIDLDHDGLTDIFIDARIDTWPTYRWLHANPNHTFDLRDTGIPRPPNVPVDQDYQLDKYRFMRLGDVNGDGVADLIECVDPSYLSDTATPHWTVRLWSPSLPGGPGFEPTARTIPHVDGVLGCGWGTRAIYIVDTDGDGTAELVVPFNGGTYGAIRYVAGNQWKSDPLHLPFQSDLHPFAKLHFLDANADGLSDVIMTGLGQGGCLDASGNLLGPTCGSPPPSNGAWSTDLPFLFTNMGGTFADVAATLPGQLSPNFWTDVFGDAAVPVDFNGDGRMDLLLPVHDHCGDGTDDPCWVVLQSSLGGDDEMTPVDTHIPTVTNKYGVAILENYVPRVTDVDGNGRHDFVVPDPDDRTRFHVYTNDGPQDLLTSITDGMSPLDPGDPGFLPTVEIHYGNLVDRSITKGIAPSSLDYDEQTYLAHADANNGCAYPRACVVGPERVVSSYHLNNGHNQRRSFSVKYRDARFHLRGRGFLGFGERIVIDTNTASGTAEFYDNVSHDPVWDVFPFAGQVVRSWTWSTEKPQRADPGRVSMSFAQRTLIREETNAHQTYLTMPVSVHTMREEGVMSPAPGKSVLRFVAAAAQTPLSVLGESWDYVSVHDAYGNVLSEVHEIDGADLKTTITRTFDNDPTTWLVGQLRSEHTCSAALGKTQCRTTELDYNTRGEVIHTSAGDPADPGTQLSVDFGRDKYGHVTHATARDELGHVRPSCVSYDADGIFPYATRNALGHTTYSRRDPGLGVLTSAVDENGLVTRFRHDRLGRMTAEYRADGTASTASITRAKNGGPQADWWALRIKTEESDGPVSTEELDSLGRTVHAWTIASEVKSCGASVCKPGLQLEQETTYDFLGRVTRVTVPWLSGDTLTGKLHHDYAYDASGRLTQHTEPWGRVTTFQHMGLATAATDWLGTTVTQTDALGRPVNVIDEKGYATQTLYGPFGALWATIRYAGQTTVSERDAYGRVVREIDPDRGETEISYDGFGEALTVDDAAGRHYVFDYDALGRLVRRTDLDGETTWEYDTAAHGIGRIAAVTNDASVKRYAYDALARPAAIALEYGVDAFSASFDYDPQGRLKRVTYPKAPGVAPLVVTRDYDAFGNVIAIRDDGAPAAKPFWQLDALDGAGRAAEESFANGVRATHEFVPASGLVKRIQALRGLIKLQDLEYAYDPGLRMKSRADRMQVGTKGVRTELFTHDALDRLTCSRLVDVPFGQEALVLDKACALSIQYDPTGNITYKSDVGLYTYDPAHPHAVKAAGTSSYGYDAVGNQKDRPGESIEYTAFDLPRMVDKGLDFVQFAYDGGQQRIAKSTGGVETLYFEGLYERVRDYAQEKTWHRYYVAAGSATLVITRHPGQSSDGIAYLHTEALGSTDMVTNATGAVLERRSHDAFGARRNPKWGQAWSGATASKGAPLGFTGHEEDEELGLVNMRGRIYDPKIGRFLQTDPIVSAPHFGQSWNRYSYVLNSPLNFVDPSGFVPSRDNVIWTQPLTVYGTPPTMEQRLGGAIDLARSGGSSDWFPWPKDAARDDKAQGAAGVPQAVQESSAFAPGSMGSMDSPTPGNADPARLAQDPVSKLREAGIGSGQAVFRHLRNLAMPSPVGYARALLGLDIGDNAVRGARADGAVGAVAGAVNTLNPFYQLGVGVVSTMQHVDAGDTRAAADSGTTLAIGVATTILAAKAGAAGEGTTAVGGPRPPTAYSVAFEANIPRRGIGSYPSHFIAANEQLLRAMGDADMAAALRGILGEHFEGGILSPSGRVLPRSPDSWTWHHVPGQPGALHLVPRSQHTAGSPFYLIMHPDGSGGMKEWGAQY